MSAKRKSGRSGGRSGGRAGRLRRGPGVFLHRVLRALRALAAAFRTAGPSGGAHRTGPGRGRSVLAPGGRTAWHRPNPWPFCPGCRHRVAALCEKGCGMCPGCCPGHRDDKPEGGDQSGMHAWGDR